MKVQRYEAPLPEVMRGLFAGMEENGMLLFTYTNVQENARERGLMSATANRLLEVFSLEYTLRVWEADVSAGASIPVCIRVCEGSDGNTYASYPEPSAAFAAYDNEALSELGAELDPIFARIVERGALG